MGRLPRNYVVGAGRWGSWLARRLKATVGLAGIVGFRESATQLAQELGVELVDRPRGKGAILWVCLPDDGISDYMDGAINQLPQSGAMVHASGTVPLMQWADPTGVMWPIQSITADVEPDWARLPLVVQASHPEFGSELYEIATRVSGVPPTRVRDDEERGRLHLGACITQNFSNLLWTLVDELYAGSQLDSRALLPLLENHLGKLRVARAATQQTGPAARGDISTIRRHLELLEGHDDAREAYALLSAMIERRAGGE